MGLVSSECTLCLDWDYLCWLSNCIPSSDTKWFFQTRWTPIDITSFITSYLLATEWKTLFYAMCTWLTKDCFSYVATFLKPKWLSAGFVYCYVEKVLMVRMFWYRFSDWVSCRNAKGICLTAIIFWYLLIDRNCLFMLINLFNQVYNFLINLSINLYRKVIQFTKLIIIMIDFDK